MRLNWLESKAVSMLFFCSVVVFSSLCAFMFFLAIPGILQFLNASSAKNFIGFLFAALAVLGFPSVVVLFFGMAIFCVARDHSTIGTKVLWFALFFFSGPIGSTVYYFVRYRGHTKGKGASAAPEPRIVSDWPTLPLRFRSGKDNSPVRAKSGQRDE